jgi:hypothetical protein
MVEISAGLVKSDTLTVTSTSSGAVQASTIVATHINSPNFTTNDLTAGNVDVSGNLNATTIDVTGSLTANTVDVTGTLTAGTVDVSGNLNANVIVGTLTSTTVDVSGNLNATTLNVGGNVTATNFGYQNLDLSGNLSVEGSFSLYGLNNYEGNIQSGDIVSVNSLGYVTAAQTNTYMRTLLVAGDAFPGGNPFWQDTSYNILINEIVYWSNNFLANSITKLSATLLVPFKGASPFAPTGLPKNSSIVSYKHGTLTSTYQYTTLWRAMVEAAAGQVPTFNVQADPTGWMFACTGHVVVCADNVSYGKSVGAYDYQNVGDETTSQYAAIVATTQLMNLKPELFYGQFVGVNPVNVINSGYSLGAVQCVNVAQLIKNTDLRNPYVNTNPNNKALNLIQTIAGAPLNAYQLIVNAFELNFNNPTLWALLYFTLLSLGDVRRISLKDSVRPNIYSDVFPVLNQFYANTDINSLSQYFKLQNITSSSVLSAYLTQNPGNQPISPPPPYTNGYLSLTDTSNYVTINTTGYITPDQFYYNPYYSDCSSHNFALNNSREAVFYTNYYVDYADLSGSPINVIYSTGDELACNNAGSSPTYSATSPNIFVGDPSTDLIYGTYKAWVDSSNVLYAPNGIWTQSKSWIDLSGGLISGGYTSSSVSTNPIAIALNTTQNTNSASVIRVNNDGGIYQGAENLFLQHNGFGLSVFQLGVRTYLDNLS